MVSQLLLWGLSKIFSGHQTRSPKAAACPQARSKAPQTSERDQANSSVTVVAIRDILPGTYISSGLR